MKNTALILLLLLLPIVYTFGQDIPSKNKPNISVKYHTGFVLPHHPSIRYLVESRTKAFEVNVGWRTHSNDPWAKLYAFPEFGVGLYHGGLGNGNVLGKATALFPYAELPFLRNQSFEWTYRIGMGVAYVNKHFDPVTNYSNIAIGSRWNAFFNLNTDTRFKISPSTFITSGMGLVHLSNGSVKSPNKGINIFTYNIGLNYHFGNIKRIAKKSTPTPSIPKHKWETVWSAGSKQTTEKDPHHYFTTSLTTNYSRKVSPIQFVGLGIDLFYDESTNRGKWDFDPQTDFKHRFRQAIFVSHDFVYANFSFITHLGFYTLYEEKPSTPFYTRIGLRYYIKENFVTNLSLKAHLGKADFIEFGIGYRWNKY
ncbi:MAG: acyloxyacyl hydrolase [Marinifilaceae bacterium]